MPEKDGNQGLWHVAQHVWNTASRELERMSSYLDSDTFSKCVYGIAECTGRVVTSGCGTSGAAARKIAHSLSCVERPALFLSPSDAVHGGLGVAQRGDVAILISKGGGTKEVVGMIPSLKAKGVTIFGVTENHDSLLASEADLVVPVQIEREADEFDMLATTSTMAVVAYFDAVCIALMRHMGYTREQFAVIHPGGAVGERLLGREHGGG